MAYNHLIVRRLCKILCAKSAEDYAEAIEPQQLARHSICPLPMPGQLRSCFEIIALVIYTTFPAIFTFLIGHVATATLPLPKVKLSRKIHITNFGNHFKTASKKIVPQKICGGRRD